MAVFEMGHALEGGRQKSSRWRNSMRPKGSALQLEAKRQLAIDLHRSGKTIQEMETTLGVTRRSIYRWLSIYKEEGHLGIQSHRPQNRSLCLTKKDIKKLKIKLRKMNTQLTAKLVNKIIKRFFNVGFNEKYIYRFCKKQDIPLTFGKLPPGQK